MNIYSFLAFSRNKEGQKYFRDLSLRIHRAQKDVAQNLPALSAFTDFAKESQLDSSTKIDSANLIKHSGDPQFLNRLCAAGILAPDGSDFQIVWQDDDGAVRLAVAALHRFDSRAIDEPTVFADLFMLDRLFEGNALLPFAAAIPSSPRKTNLRDHIVGRFRELLKDNFFDAYEIEDKRGFPGFSWAHLHRRLEHFVGTSSATSPEGEFLRLLTVFSTAWPNDLYALKNEFRSPARLMVLHNRFDPTLIPTQDEKFENDRIAAYIAWVLASHFSDKYLDWQREAGSWRNLKPEDVPTPAELLLQKGKVDTYVLRKSQDYFQALARAGDHRILNALFFCELTLESSDRAQPTARGSAYWHGEQLIRTLGGFFKNLSASGIDNLADEFQAFLTDAGIFIDGRSAILSDIAIHSDVPDSFRDAAKKAILFRLCQIGDKPFYRPPHYYEGASVRHDRHLLKVATLVFADADSGNEILDALQKASDAQFTGPEDVDNQELHRKSACEFLIRLYLLAPTVPDEIAGRARKQISSVYSAHLKESMKYGALRGARHLLNERGISIDPVEAPPEALRVNKTFFGRRLVETEKFDEAKTFYKDELLPLWRTAKNFGGENSESIANWMYSLVRTQDATPSEYKEAISIFERNRACIGVDEQQVHTFAAIIAERAGDFDKALLFTEKAIQVNPGDLDLWMNKASLLIRAQRGPEAYQLCSSIPYIYEHGTRIKHLLLASQIAASKELPLVAGALAQTLNASSPDDDDARYNHAVAYVLSGEIQKAIDLCKIIQTHTKGEPFSAELLVKLKDDSYKRYAQVLGAGLPVKIPIIYQDEIAPIDVRDIPAGTNPSQLTTIAIAQLHFERDDTPEAAQRSLDSIKWAINEALKAGAEFFFFQELCIPVEHLEELKTLAKDKKIWIAGGARYQLVEGAKCNKSILISPTGEHFDGPDKICPSPLENGLQPGFEIGIFSGTPLGRIAVLICFDIYHPQLKGALVFHDIDMVFVPSVNKDVDRLEGYAASLSNDLSVPIVVANATNCGHAFYDAGCYKKSFEKQFDRKNITTSSLRDQVITLKVPRREDVKQFLAYRPTQSTDTVKKASEP